MHAIHYALAWELGVRGRWKIPAFFMMGILMPMILYGSLAPYGLDYQSREGLLLHCTFVQVIAFLFAFGIVASHGSSSRLYSAPISNDGIVAWQLVSGAVLLAAEVALAATLLNVLFDVQWPVWGPALFAATVWATAQPMIAVSHLSLRNFITTVVPVLLLIGWFQSRYGGWFTKPTHYWRELTAGEVFVMLTVIVLSYFATVWRVSNDRCGERAKTFGLLARIERFLDKVGEMWPGRQRAFRSPFEAQVWYEWCQKGLGLPVSFAAYLLVFAGLWLNFWFIAALYGTSLNWSQFNEGMASSAGLLAGIASAVGFLTGMSSTDVGDKRNPTLQDALGQIDVFRMRSFIATRPLTDSQMSRSILAVALKSVTCTWLIWIAAILVYLAVARAFGQSPQLIDNPTFGHWYLPMTFLCAWIGMTNVATLGLTGRAALTFSLAIGGVIGAGVLILLARLFLPDSLRLQLAQASIVLISLIIIALTVLAYGAATRVKLIQRFDSLFAFIIVASIVTSAIALRPTELPTIAYPMLVAFAALVVLPWVTTPLAISINRHR